MGDCLTGWWIIPLAVIGAVAWVGIARADVIDFDAGGYIGARADLILSAEPAEIRGYCASSCTMHMANGCVWPGAVLVFHGPVTDDPVLFDHYSRVMASHYPPALAAWFMDAGRFTQTTLTGAEAIRLGARQCTDEM